MGKLSHYITFRAINIILLAVLLPVFLYAEKFTASITKPGADNDIRKEVTERSLRSVTYKNSDGTFTKEISLGPRNYKGNDNKWHEIDTGIETRRGGGFENNKNIIKSVFREKSGDNTVSYKRGGNEISWELKSVSFIGAGNKPVLEFAKNVAGAEAENNKIVYNDIFENFDDEYKVLPGKIKNNLVLNKFPDDENINKARYLKIEGVFHTGFFADVLAGGEKIKGRFGTESGFDIKINENEFFHIHPVYVRDSYGKGEEKLTPVSEKNRSFTKGKYIIEKTFNKIKVTILVDIKWLSAKERVYPVYIDPSVSLKSFEVEHQTLTYDTEIWSANPSENYGVETTMWIGRDDGDASVSRALFRFGEVDSIPSTAIVRSSLLKIRLESLLSGTSGTEWFEAREVTTS